MTSACILVDTTAGNSPSSTFARGDNDRSATNPEENEMLALTERSKQNLREVWITRSRAERVQKTAYFAAFNLVLLGGAVLAKPDASAWISLFFPIMLVSCTVALIFQIRLGQQGL